MDSPLKWHGGKHYLAPKILAMMPPHVHYVEPFFGGGSVLLAKDPDGVSEVANDLYGTLVNFWTVLASDFYFPNFLRKAEATPFSQDHWERSCRTLDRAGWESSPCVNLALAFFVCCRQRLAGRMKSFSPLSKTRTRRGMNEQASAWIRAVDGLAQVHARLRRVAICNDEAVNVMAREDGPDTLFYCDPPYLPETRSSPNVYRHEMSLGEHLDFLEVCKSCRGKVIISGYPGEVYEVALAGWNRRSFDLPNNSAGGESKRRVSEVLWANF